MERKRTANDTLTLNQMKVMRESLILHKAQIEPISDLSIEDKGKLFDAIIKYQFEDLEPHLPPLLALAFKYFKNQLDIDNKKYEKTCKRNQINGKKGGRPVSGTLNKPKKPSGLFGNPENPNEPKEPENEKEKGNENGNDIKKKTNRFSPPSFAEIENYFSEQIKSKGLSINPNLEAEKFESFYASKNWYVGRNKMAVWKKAAISWLSRLQSDKNGKSMPESTPPKGLSR